MNLTPENNMERILNGEDVTPNNRTEYFLKQAIANAGSGGGGGGDDKSPLVVKGVFAAREGTITVDITNSGYTLADIFAAAQAGRAVFLEYTEDGTTTRMGLGTREESNGAYTLGFSISITMSDKPVVAVVEFDNSLVGVFNIAAAQ